MTNGTAYTAMVRAVNVAGAGPSAQADPATPTSMPSAPRNLYPTAGDKSASILFDAPADNGGLTMAGYQASGNGGATWKTVDVTGDSTLTAGGERSRQRLLVLDSAARGELARCRSGRDGLGRDSEGRARSAWKRQGNPEQRRH